MAELEGGWQQLQPPLLPQMRLLPTSYPLTYVQARPRRAALVLALASALVLMAAAPAAAAEGEGERPFGCRRSRPRVP